MSMKLLVESYSMQSAKSMDTHADDMITNLGIVFNSDWAPNWSIYPTDDCYAFPTHSMSDIVLPGRYRSLLQDDLTDSRIVRTYNIIYRDKSLMGTPHVGRDIRHTFRALMENKASTVGQQGSYTRIRDDAMGDIFFMVGEFAGIDDLHASVKGDRYDAPDFIGFSLKFNCSPRRYSISGTQKAVLFTESVTLRSNDIPATSGTTNNMPYASPVLMLKCGTSVSSVEIGGLTITLKANVTTPCVIDFDTGKIDGIDAIQGLSGKMGRAFFETIYIRVTGTPGQCAVLPRWYIV